MKPIKILRILFAFLMLGFFLISSCTADKINNDLKINYKPDTYEIDLSKVNQIITNGGMKVNFSDELIENINSLIKTKKITLEVLEFYTLQDFIVNDLQTVSKEGRLLESQGMFKISFKHSGQEFDVENLEGLTVGFPINKYVERIDEYKIFKGEVNPNSKISWIAPKEIPISSSNVEAIESEVLLPDMLPFNGTGSSYTYTYDSKGNVLDSTLRFNGHAAEAPLAFLNISIQSLDWINIDRFVKMREDELAEINVLIDKRYSDQTVGIVLKNLNSFISLYPNENDDKKFISSIKLPKGEEVKIVGFGRDGSDYYFGDTDFRIGEFNNVKLIHKLMPTDRLPESLKGNN